MTALSTRVPAVCDGPPNHRARFRTDVLRGLGRPERELPCKYFYDERGSRLFETICELDEYYLKEAIKRCQAAEP